ncbi:FAD-dependent oxidoreductase [Cupriavidus sp. 2TAF22]|uniref:FAD-dependent oxidoreductase n=1 Tax=unclassified Cupriavidus TaxID=2640874 RepID=UPI003F8E7452
MDVVNTDVAVIGAGIAGLTVALRLAEQGIRTLVVEKGEQGRYPCNTRMAGGAFHVAHQDVAEDPEVILDAIVSRAGNSVAKDLAEALAHDVGQATQWLQQHGVRFIKVGHEPYRRHTLAPPIATQGRHYWQGRGGDVLLRTLAARLEANGGTVLYGTRAERLTMRGGQCVGFLATQSTAQVGIEAGAVVICDGGFHSNLDLLREHIAPAPEKLKQRNARAGCGDGLRMAGEVGAQFVGMTRFYGHVLAQDAIYNDDLSPFPMLDLVCAAGIVVDRSGRRFMDEGLGGVTMANTIAAQADPLGATVIFDSDIWNGPGREYLISANPTLITNGGTVYASSDVEGLAQQAGLPANQLAESVAQHNAAIEAAGTGELRPRRSTGVHRAWPIRTAPFHAVKLCAGITYTMGGIATDAAGRVLDIANRPIANLYAAGCTTGGIEGGGDLEQVAYIGGLSRSTVFALRAANAIASTWAAA